MKRKAPADPTPELSLDDVYRCLCWYDERSPYWADTYEGDDDAPEPRLNCFCDNCFYGRDRLALEIIRLRNAR